MVRKIKILIVDDSFVFQRFLKLGLVRYPEFEIVGSAMNAYDARTKAEQLQPDVITLDVEMPGMSGIDFLKRQMLRKKIPVILVSSLNINVFSALSYGAVDFVKKPDMTSGNDADRFMKGLARKIITASRAKVIPHNAGKRGSIAGQLRDDVLNSWVIAIGASTGGTEAILQTLEQFPERMPGIVVTQHMPEGFTKMYAERLDRICRLKVKEAKNGDTVQAGQVLIAPGNLQMRVRRQGGRYVVSCLPGERVSGHRPSVDVLFSSVAEAAARYSVGVIMTGMGQDGAKGLLQMRQKGAYTIGQDKESCVVYGMPMVAWNIGAVCRQCPGTEIARNVFQYLQYPRI